MSTRDAFSHAILDGSEREVSGHRQFKAIVTIALQKDFYKSHMRHFMNLSFSIREKFGDLVEVKSVEAHFSGEFSVHIRLSKGPDAAPGQDRRPAEPMFSKLREGFLPPVDELLQVIELVLFGNRTVAKDCRRLSRVQCVLIYSSCSPEYAQIFKRLENQTTSQLNENVNFEVQMVGVPDVLEVWINGHLIYSLWSSSQLPVLHDVIAELNKAAACQPINTLPRLR